MRRTAYQFKEKLVKESPQGIVFVDGENTVAFLSDLFDEDSVFANTVLPERCEIAIFFSHRKSYEHHIGRFVGENVTYLKSKTLCKDAVDIAIGVCAGSLDVILPEEVSFYFFTSDHFAKEVVLNLEFRKSYIIDPRDMTLKKLNDGGKELLPRSNKFKAMNKNTNNENDLRILYKRYWSGSQAAFSTMSGIDPSTFGKWLSCSKSSPASTKAVKNWLKTVE